MSEFMEARLQRITIYPIKSLDGVDVTAATVLPSGALAGDRRFALVDSDGRFVNGKRTPAIHAIRAEIDPAAMTVRLRHGPSEQAGAFSLIGDRVPLSHWFSSALGISCDLAENAAAGFPDDTEAPGPTLLSTATLMEVAGWFPDLALDEVRRRFRANLEIGGVPPFWEDRLAGPPGTEMPFQIGRVRWLGITACQRCVVPARASRGGEATPQFQKIFSDRRRAMLPAWAPAERFDHFYRLAVNLRLAPGQAAGSLNLGDTIHLDRPRP
jgi:uncharacterized protein YcbX